VDQYDVIVVGGGPAGLSAALMLGRCRRRVLVCDRGEPRNQRSAALHGYLTRDGIPPVEFRDIGRRELAPYGVDVRCMTVTGATRDRDGFIVTLGDGRRARTRFLLLATGVRDELPPVPGLPECYGRSVFHCPYCDGWEWRDRRLGVLGHKGAPLALALKTWSSSVAWFTHGGRVDAPTRRRLGVNEVPIATGRVSRLIHADGLLEGVELADGGTVPCDALFFTSSQHPQDSLAGRLGCTFNRKGTVSTGRSCGTNVEGVFVAGDASHDAQFVVVAAAEGVKAAVAINQALQRAEIR
jgi:thioredoxin reductase